MVWLQRDCSLARWVVHVCMNLIIYMLNTSAVALRVLEGDEKGTWCLGILNTQGWWPCSIKKIIVPKSREVKTRWSNSRPIWQNLRKGLGSKRAVLPIMMLLWSCTCAHVLYNFKCYRAVMRNLLRGITAANKTAGTEIALYAPIWTWTALWKINTLFPVLIVRLEIMMA
jgi:hypothetical protein